MEKKEGQNGPDCVERLEEKVNSFGGCAGIP
jgi:hypothetical protein